MCQEIKIISEFKQVILLFFSICIINHCDNLCDPIYRLQPTWKYTQWWAAAPLLLSQTSVYLCICSHGVVDGTEDREMAVVYSPLAKDHLSVPQWDKTTARTSHVKCHEITFVVNWHNINKNWTDLTTTAVQTARALSRYTWLSHPKCIWDMDSNNVQ